MAIKTTDLEKEVLNALFRQEKPIIFSMKAGLEKLGKGHHKTSHMNRTQHADALIKGLDFRGNKTKQDWGGENLWGKVLNFSNEKKPLNDTRLNAIWEQVKKDKTWDEERFKGIEVEKKVDKIRGSLEEVEGEVIVPQGPPPQPARDHSANPELIVVQKNRIRELEKKNRELLNEVQAERRQGITKGFQEDRKRESIERERNQLERRLAFYEMKPVIVLEEYDEGEKNIEFETPFSLSQDEYSDFILIPFQETRLLYDKRNEKLYGRNGFEVGNADYAISYEDRKISSLDNIELDESQGEGLSNFRKREDFQGERRVEQRIDLQRRELNKMIREFENGGSPVIIGDYGGEMITIEEREEGMKFPKEYVVYNDNADKIGDWSKEEGIINRITPQKKEEVEEESSPEGFEDFIEIEYEGNDFLIDEDTDKVYAMDGIYVGIWDADDGIVWKNKEEKKKHDIIRKKETGAPPSSDEESDAESEVSEQSDIESEVSSQSDIDSDISSESDIESSDEESNPDMETIQLSFVDLIVDKITADDKQSRLGKGAGRTHTLMNEEAEYYGFFNYPLDKSLNNIRQWSDMRDFVWLDSGQRQEYIDSMRDIMEDEGKVRNIPESEEKVPTAILPKIPENLQDQQIGGMTKGHFHKEVPVILHGGELVIPKKHVAEVMKQSDLAHQISKIPPTWQKIKKIVK